MSNQTPAVSIIVAVYKAENYLHRCVDSLLAQTFTDFEILLIDDGSPDRSGDICDEYARMDSRIRVFHKENGGVSSARQCGIDHAKGEYTIHADPDDWVEPTMLEELYKKAKEEDADMVICDYYVDFLKEKKYVIQQPQSLKAENVLAELFQTLHGSLCNKLIKRICYNQYSAFFPNELNICEDFMVCVQFLKNPIKISYLQKAFYYYSQYGNENSITRKGLVNHIDQDELIIKLIIDLLREVQYKKLIYKLEFNAIYHIFQTGILSNEEFKKRFSKYMNDIIAAKNKNVLVKIMLIMSFLGCYRQAFLLNGVCKKINKWMK